MANSAGLDQLRTYDMAVPVLWALATNPQWRKLYFSGYVFSNLTTGRWQDVRGTFRIIVCVPKSRTCKEYGSAGTSEVNAMLDADHGTGTGVPSIIEMSCGVVALTVTGIQWYRNSFSILQPRKPIKPRYRVPALFKAWQVKQAVGLLTVKTI